MSEHGEANQWDCCPSTGEEHEYETEAEIQLDVDVFKPDGMVCSFCGARPPADDWEPDFEAIAEARAMRYGPPKWVDLGPPRKGDL